MLFHAGAWLFQKVLAGVKVCCAAAGAADADADADADAAAAADAAANASNADADADSRAADDRRCCWLMLMLTLL